MRQSKLTNWFIVLVLVAGTVLSGLASAGSYDPLSVRETHKIQTLDLTVVDEDRDRKLPLRVYLPDDNRPAAVVLFSHGLGGSCKANSYLGEHWARRGYLVVYIQHPGSDVSVWKDKPPMERFAALKKAANATNFFRRVRDVPAVLDQLQKWNRSKQHTLHNRLDLEHVGMSGHSFGAITTQAVSGQRFRGRPMFTEKRIDAAVMFSPSSPRRSTPKAAFSEIKTPWMLMTGTRDEALIGNTDVQSRLAVYRALPPGGKYEAVLHNAEHSAFTDRHLPGDTEEKNPNHHRVILALSTAFWDAWLRDKEAAKQWLNGSGPRTVMEKKDRWRHK